MQNSFGKCLTETENSKGHAEFYLAWEDTSCMTELKIVAGLIAKQTKDKALLTAHLPLCIYPIYKVTSQLILSTALALAKWPFPSFK